MSTLTLIHFILILSVIVVAKTTELQDPQTKPTNQWGYNSMKAAESKVLGPNREMTNWLSAKGQTETDSIYTYTANERGKETLGKREHLKLIKNKETKEACLVVSNARHKKQLRIKLKQDVTNGRETNS